MPRGTKKHDISSALHKPFNEIVAEKYVTKKMSCAEIAGYFYKKTNIRVSHRYIQMTIKGLGLIRTYTEAHRIALDKGRRDHSHLRKPIKAGDLRKGITLKLRYEIMKRDGFKCVLCGKSAEDGTTLVIDHIKPIVAGGQNTPDNLRTLCRACNHGKMLSEDRYV